jgi:uncharacterized membrane protein YphA (DoxX/SURF4 family)
VTPDIHVMLAGIIRVFFALIFLLAAWHKLHGLAEFSGVVRNYRILPEWAEAGFSRLLPVVELLLGLCLLTGIMPGPMTALAFVLLALFTVAIAVNVLRGRTYIDCGCFRPESGQHLSWLLVLRNIVLAAAAGYAASVHATQGGGADFLAIYPAAAGFAVLYFSAAALLGLATAAPQRQGSR